LFYLKLNHLLIMHKLNHF